MLHMKRNIRSRGKLGFCTCAGVVIYSSRQVRSLRSEHRATSTSASVGLDAPASWEAVQVANAFRARSLSALGLAMLKDNLQLSRRRRCCTL